MQDHLEGFFACVRARLGCNTNPTVIQFTAAYKRLVLGGSGKNFSLAANILAQDNTECLDILTTVKNSMDYMDTQYELDEDVELMNEFESLDPVLNKFQTSCVKYISGFVQRKLSQKLKCKTCTDVITSSAPDRDRLGLTFMKDRGGLTYASHELSKVAEIAESKIQDAKMKDKLFCDRQILNRICLKTVSTCMTEHPDIFKKADHGELHTYSLHRETALLYTVLHILPRRRTWIQKSQKLEKSLTNFLPTNKFAHGDHYFV